MTRTPDGTPYGPADTAGLHDTADTAHAADLAGGGPSPARAPRRTLGAGGAAPQPPGGRPRAVESTAEAAAERSTAPAKSGDARPAPRPDRAERAERAEQAPHAWLSEPGAADRTANAAVGRIVPLVPQAFPTSAPSVGHVGHVGNVSQVGQVGQVPHVGQLGHAGPGGHVPHVGHQLVPTAPPGHPAPLGHLVPAGHLGHPGPPGHAGGSHPGPPGHPGHAAHPGHPAHLGPVGLSGHSGYVTPFASRAGSGVDSPTLTLRTGGRAGAAPHPAPVVVEAVAATPSRGTVVALRPEQPAAVLPELPTAPPAPPDTVRELPRSPAALPAAPEPAATGVRAQPQPRHRAFRPRGATLLMGADAAGAVAGALAAGAPPVAAAVATTVLLLALYQGRLYRPGFAPSALGEVPAVAGRAAVGWGAAAAVVTSMDLPGLLGAAAVTTAAACLLRASVYGLRRRAARRAPGSTLIVGAGPGVRQVAAALHAHPEYGMRPVGVVTPGPGTDASDPAVRLLAAALHAQAPDDPPDLPLPVLAGHAEITRAVIQNSVRFAVVVGPPTLDARTTATVRLLAAQGCCIWQAEEGGRARRGPVPTAHLWGFSCRRLEVEPYPAPRPGRWAKRAMDAGAAGLALLVLAPVLGACALAVRLTDGPGVLFHQERIGLGGRPFTLLKFRTLRPRDADESATRWNIAGDHRMSAVGRLLRRTSLDELPQLWNILRGDMSLVGPRPERPYFVEQFSTTYPGYEDRHRMPAGLTGLAQVHGLRGDTSIADRARFDNHYIDSWSLWQDVAIILRTALELFRVGGS
ncbi:exopolysaccharide biosynthesis polyprenyl glycosylphosphotransferase [Actinacidiphila rubida]|uniref:Exopolysaccharide biosynthesis polyprenyl glycosylphosphotransferase n=1 Tax=Actinacidiphila rubida TaxID=310780 RepID=A0A1H8TP30_9ACTN|nr:exopolysaccharide biosynthesis polyprenyl glycosylphosphotransferase [Actinacidiphila rubida]SEO92627.1 exopolysaccharide biosynthesis polyprenyl glycosylphosphotransferase [Actinacidiphila rubida]